MNETIYIRLVDEGIDVWRPVTAKKGSMPNSFFILPAPHNIIPPGESWEFSPGSYVLVRESILEEQKVNVAYALTGN